MDERTCVGGQCSQRKISNGPDFEPSRRGRQISAKRGRESPEVMTEGHGGEDDEGGSNRDLAGQSAIGNPGARGKLRSTGATQ